MDSSISNNSGMGKNSPIPEEIKGWNWGAFFLSWIWGIGNSSYKALFVFIPIVGLIMPFVLGVKGNKWAWQNRVWRDVDHFKKTQKRWTISGLILIFVVIPSFVLLIGGGMKKSVAYNISISELRNNQEVIELIGQPVESGFFVSGNIHIGAGTGQANLSYSINGPKGEATAHVVAIKEIEGWELKQLIVYSEEKQRRIDIIVPDNN